MSKYRPECVTVSENLPEFGHRIHAQNNVGVANWSSKHSFQYTTSSFGMRSSPDRSNGASYYYTKHSEFNTQHLRWNSSESAQTTFSVTQEDNSATIGERGVYKQSAKSTYNQNGYTIKWGRSTNLTYSYTEANCSTGEVITDTAEVCRDGCKEDDCNTIQITSRTYPYNYTRNVCFDSCISINTEGQGDTFVRLVSTEETSEALQYDCDCTRECRTTRDCVGRDGQYSECGVDCTWKCRQCTGKKTGISRHTEEGVVTGQNVCFYSELAIPRAVNIGARGSCFTPFVKQDNYSTEFTGSASAEVKRFFPTLTSVSYSAVQVSYSLNKDKNKGFNDLDTEFPVIERTTKEVTLTVSRTKYQGDETGHYSDQGAWMFNRIENTNTDKIILQARIGHSNIVVDDRYHKYEAIDILPPLTWIETSKIDKEPVSPQITPTYTSQSYDTSQTAIRRFTWGEWARITNTHQYDYRPKGTSRVDIYKYTKFTGYSTTSNKIFHYEDLEVYTTEESTEDTAEYTTAGTGRFCNARGEIYTRFSGDPQTSTATYGQFVSSSLEKFYPIEFQLLYNKFDYSQYFTSYKTFNDDASFLITEYPSVIPFKIKEPESVFYTPPFKVKEEDYGGTFGMYVPPTDDPNYIESAPCNFNGCNKCFHVTDPCDCGCEGGYDPYSVTTEAGGSGDGDRVQEFTSAIYLDYPELVDGTYRYKQYLSSENSKNILFEKLTFNFYLYFDKIAFEQGINTYSPYPGYTDYNERNKFTVQSFDRGGAIFKNYAAISKHEITSVASLVTANTANSSSSLQAQYSKVRSEGLFFSDGDGRFIRTGRSFPNFYYETNVRKSGLIGTKLYFADSEQITYKFASWESYEGTKTSDDTVYSWEDDNDVAKSSTTTVSYSSSYRTNSYTRNTIFDTFKTQSYSFNFTRLGRVTTKLSNIFYKIPNGRIMIESAYSDQDLHAYARIGKHHSFILPESRLEDFYTGDIVMSGTSKDTEVSTTNTYNCTMSIDEFELNTESSQTTDIAYYMSTSTMERGQETVTETFRGVSQTALSALYPKITGSDSSYAYTKFNPQNTICEHLMYGLATKYTAEFIATLKSKKNYNLFESAKDTCIIQNDFLMFPGVSNHKVFQIPRLLLGLEKTRGGTQKSAWAPYSIEEARSYTIDFPFSHLKWYTASYDTDREVTNETTFTQNGNEIQYTYRDLDWQPVNAVDGRPHFTISPETKNVYLHTPLRAGMSCDKTDLQSDTVFFRPCIIGGSHINTENYFGLEGSDGNHGGRVDTRSIYLGLEVSMNISTRGGAIVPSFKEKFEIVFDSFNRLNNFDWFDYPKNTYYENYEELFDYEALDDLGKTKSDS